MISGKSHRLAAELLAFWVLLVAPPAFGAAIHPLILEQVAGAGEAEFVIVLEEQADLGSVSALRTKAERGRAVFESLTEVAWRTQAPLIAELEARDLPHQPYWIANMIWVRGDLEAVELLSARTDVRRLDANPGVRLDVRPDSAAAAPTGIEWAFSRCLPTRSGPWAIPVPGLSWPAKTRVTSGITRP